MPAIFPIKAILDPSGVVAGSRTASASLIGLQRQVNVLGATFTKVFGVVGLGIGIKTSIDLIADFQQSIATASAIATRDIKFIQGNMAALSEEARRLGRTTRFTAKEAADGMLFLARAGFKVNEVLAITNQTLLLAQAGNLGVGRAADIVTNVMAGFSVEVDQATRFVDVLAAAASSTNTNIEQLGDALKFAGPVAAAVGVEVEEAAAAVGALSNAGLQGTLAGTGLRRVLSELEAPSTKAAKFLDDLGLKTRDVKVSTNGLVPVIEKLAKTGFDVGDALEFFGDRGGPAFQVIRSAVEQGFLQRMTSEFIRSGGRARDIAKVMDETLKGALFAVKSAFEAVILAAGELKTFGGLEDVVRGITSVLRKLANHIDIVAGVLQVLATVIVTVLVRRALLFLTSAMRKLFLVILGNPVGAFTLALIAAAAAMVAFSDKIAFTQDGTVTLQDVFAGVLDTIQESVTKTGDFIIEKFGSATDSAASDSNQLGLAILSFFQVIAQVLDAVVGSIFLIPSSLVIAFQEAGNVITDLLKIQANRWIRIFQDTVNFIIKQLNRIPKVNIQSADFQALKFEVDNTKVDSFFDNLREAFKAGLESLPVAGGQGPLEKALLESIDKSVDIAAERTKNKFKTELADSFEPGEIVANKELVKFRALIRNLSEELDLLSKTNDQREIANRLKSIEARFEDGLQPKQESQIVTLLQRIQATKRQNDLYNQLRGPQEDLIRREQTLDELYKANRINLQEYGTELENIRLQTLSFAQDIDSGEARALIRIKQEIRDLASLTEQTLVGAFNSVENAIVDLVSTGEADFHQLAQSIFAETTRILLRLALLKAFGSFFSPSLAGAGGGGGTPVNDFQVAQMGKSFRVGGSGGIDSQLVIGRATPGEVVNISPPGHEPQSATQPPVINVNNVVVQDPEEAISAMNSPEGETVFMNFIQKNRDSIKTQLGG